MSQPRLTETFAATWLLRASLLHVDPMHIDSAMIIRMLQVFTVKIMILNLFLFLIAVFLFPKQKIA